MKTVLVVDDKELMRDSVATTLERAGFEIVTAPDGPTALEMIARKRPDAVVTDLKMPQFDGIELVGRVKAIDADLPIVVMTAFGTIETAVKAMKAGAFDYLTKPFEGDELIIAIKRGIEHGNLLRENAVLRAEVAKGAAGPAGGERGLDRLIGAAESMRKLREQLGAIAASQGTVLINGESGVGKEVVARTIHELSPRADGPFLAVNCAALSESLLESELFGHERGAFTGADKLRKGRFELADGGTLLLDEVSEIGAQIQAKLLRVLQERSFERVGSSVTIGTDVRVIATSNRDLQRSIDKGEFRQDLYFRLNVLPVQVPPLRARSEDVPALAEHFTRLICRREGREEVRFGAGAMELLRGYRWPGNVRELQNICERAVVLSGAVAPGRREIGAELIEPWITLNAPAVVVPSSMLEGKPSMPNGHVSVTAEGHIRQLEDIERDVIVQTLTRLGGHRQKTAHALGIGVRTLGLKLKKWKEMQLVAGDL